MKPLFALSLLIVTLIFQPVQAAVIGSFAYLDPSATISPTESVEVWVRLSINPFSDDLHIDKSDDLLGLDASEFPTQATLNLDGGTDRTYTTYDVAGGYVGGFDSQFSDAYDLDIDAFSEPTHWFAFDGTLQAGHYMDFLLFTYTPTGGVAAPGTYTLDSAVMGFMLYGTNQFGELLQTQLINFYDRNSFTRTVTPIPLPAAAWLFITALLGLGGFKRLRRQAAA